MFILIRCCASEVEQVKAQENQCKNTHICLLANKCRVDGGFELEVMCSSETQTSKEGYRQIQTKGIFVGVILLCGFKINPFI